MDVDVPCVSERASMCACVRVCVCAGLGCAL